MLEILTFSLLVAEVAILSRMDRKRFNTWVTPFNALAYPYTAVVFLILVLGPPLDFVSLYLPSVFIWIVGLFFFWASGTFLSWALLDYRYEVAKDVLAVATYNGSKNERLATRLTWVAIPLMIYGVYTSVNSLDSWTQIGTQEFKGLYSHGVHGHAQVLASLSLISLIGLYRPGNRRGLITIVAALAPITLAQSKGHTIVVLIGGLLVRLLRKVSHLSLRQLLSLIAATYIVFNLIYLFSMSAVSAGGVLTATTLQALARHYCYYLFAGPLAFSEAVRNGISDVGGEWTLIFAPFINVYRVLFHAGPMIEAISAHSKGMITGVVSNHEVDVNVYTFFGTLYLYLGTAGALAYVIVVAFLCYALLLFARFRRSVWLTSGYCYVAGNLAFGFFEFYFWHLDVFEVLAWSVLLSYGSRLMLEQSRKPKPLQITEDVLASGSLVAKLPFHMR